MVTLWIYQVSYDCILHYHKRINKQTEILKKPTKVYEANVYFKITRVHL